MNAKISVPVWMRCLTVFALCLCFFLTACDIDNGDDNGDNGGNGGPIVEYGAIKAEGESHPLGYGEMVTVPAPVEGLNQTVIELVTSKQDWEYGGNYDFVGISVYHAGDTVPEDSYTVFDLLDGVREDRFTCNIIIHDGKNFAFDSGELSISRTLTGQYSISVDGDAMCTADADIYPIEIEYNGPIVSLN